MRTKTDQFLGEVFLWVVALSLTACGSAPSELDPIQPSTAPFPPVEAFGSPADAGLNTELSSTSESTEFVPGDTLTFGVTLFDRTVPEEQWLVQFKVLTRPEEIPPGTQAPFNQNFTFKGTPLSFPSRSALVKIATYDREGKQDHQGAYEVPADSLAFGILPGTEALETLSVDEEGVTAEFTREHLDPVLRSFVAWLSLLSLAPSNPTLKPILERVVAKPSVLTLLFHGFRIVLEGQPDFANSVPASPFAGISSRVRVLPFDVSIYGRPALAGRMLVAESQRPLNISAGILAIEAWHPGDRRKSMAIRLLASELGQPPPLTRTGEAPDAFVTERMGPLADSTVPSSSSPRTLCARYTTPGSV